MTILYRTNIEAHIEIPLAELASMIAEMGDDEQAMLFSLLADEMTNTAPWQLECIQRHRFLTDEGRALMRLIGEYSETP